MTADHIMYEQLDSTNFSHLVYYKLRDNLQIQGELGQSVYLENHDDKEELFENINLLVDSSWAHPGAVEKLIEKVSPSPTYKLEFESLF